MFDKNEQPMPPKDNLTHRKSKLSERLLNEKADLEIDAHQAGGESKLPPEKEKRFLVLKWMEKGISQKEAEELADIEMGKGKLDVGELKPVQNKMRPWECREYLLNHSSIQNELDRIKELGGEVHIIDNRVVIYPGPIPKAVIDTFAKRIKIHDERGIIAVEVKYEQ